MDYSLNPIGGFSPVFDIDLGEPASTCSSASSVSGPRPETMARFDALADNREHALSYWDGVRNDGTTLGAVGGTLGRVFAKAGYGFGEGLLQSHALINDAGYRTLAGAGLSHLLADRGTTQEMLGTLNTYWNSHSAGEIAEDAGALAVGGLASMGIGLAAYGTLNATLRAASNLPDVGGPFFGNAEPSPATALAREAGSADHWHENLVPDEPLGGAESNRMYTEAANLIPARRASIAQRDPGKQQINPKQEIKAETFITDYDGLLPHLERDQHESVYELAHPHTTYLGELSRDALPGADPRSIADLLGLAHASGQERAVGFTTDASVLNELQRDKGLKHVKVTDMAYDHDLIEALNVEMERDQRFGGDVSKQLAELKRRGTRMTLEWDLRPPPPSLWSRATAALGNWFKGDGGANTPQLPR